MSVVLSLVVPEHHGNATEGVYGQTWQCGCGHRTTGCKAVDQDSCTCTMSILVS